MHRYAIFSTDVTRADLNRHFGESVYELEGTQAWVVASEMATSADVSNRLGFEPGQRNGVVLKVGEYYGCYNEALWQKLETWKNAP